MDNVRSFTSLCGLLRYDTLPMSFGILYMALVKLLGCPIAREIALRNTPRTVNINKTNQIKAACMFCAIHCIPRRARIMSPGESIEDVITYAHPNAR